MSKKNEKNTSAETEPDYTNWTQNQVEEAVKKDIRAAFSLLKLIHENPTVLDVVSEQVLFQIKNLKK